jgi:enoyl-CoA hydratase/carnithine racemase
MSASLDYETLRYVVAEQIAVITLARPDQLNTFTPQMVRDLTAVLDTADGDDAVRAIIITGEGRAFCAGADLSGGTEIFEGGLSEHSPAGADGELDYSKPSARDWAGLATLRLFACVKPVIGAINGAAVGVGATMTLAMDVRIASESTRFAFLFARRGIVPEGASGWFLPRLVGISRALEWCYTGRFIGADEALAAGLIGRVVSSDSLLDAAHALAREIAENAAPVSVALTRQMMWRGLTQSHPMEAHRIDSRAVLSRGLSADVTEGVTAFLDKRPAHFPDVVSRNMPDFYPWWTDPEYE